MTRPTRRTLLWGLMLVMVCLLLVSGTTTELPTSADSFAEINKDASATTEPAFADAPALIRGAVSTKDTMSLKIVSTVIAAIEDLAGIVPTFEMPTDTSVRVGIKTIRQVDVTDMVDKLNTLLAYISTNFTVTSMTSAVLDTISPVPTNDAVTELALNTLFKLFKTLPAGFNAQADVFLQDFRCNVETGADCSVPATVGAVKLANVVLKTSSTAMNLLIAPVKAVSVPLLNAMMPTILKPVLNLDETTNRFTFLVPKGGDAVNPDRASIMRADATPMSDVGIVMALVNAANALAKIGALNLHLTTYSNTTLLVAADIRDNVDLVGLLTSKSATLLMDIGKKYLPVIGDLQPIVESMDTVSWVDAMTSLETIARGTKSSSSASATGTAPVISAVPSSVQQDADEVQTLGTSAGTEAPLAAATLPQATEPRFGDALADVLDLVTFTEAKMSDLLGLIGNIVNGTMVNIALSIDDLRCLLGGFSCNFPTHSGLRVADLTANGVSLVDTVVAPMLPSTITVLNTKIDPVLASLTTYCGNLTDGRCSILLKNEKVVKVPHVSFFIAFPILAVVVIVVLVGQNVIRRKHRIIRLLPSAKDECYESDGAPISIAHIVIEDTIVCIVAMFLLSCFVMAHFSTLAYLIIGNEWTLYLFALHTVAHLWQCGLQAEATFIIVFSGALVYVKLVVLIVCSMVLHRPRCLVVRIFEVIGGFSMVLVFVLLCFYAFMQTPGVIEVRVRPSFYLFMGGVFGSFLLGHYITYFWRFGTNIRDKPFSFDDFKDTPESDETSSRPSPVPSPLSEAHDPLGYDLEEEEGDAIQDELHNPCVVGFPKPTEIDQTLASIDDEQTVRPSCPLADKKGTVRSPLPAPQRLLSWVREFFAHGVWWPVSVPFFVVIAATVLPGYFATCITYRVGGVASVAVANVRTFTLMDQSSALGAAAATGLVMTGIVVPFAYSLFYNGIPSAAGWSTALAVVVTSAAGLLNINRFVQYVLAGPAGGMDDFYNGHATIEWPLWLQCVPGVLVYVAVVCDFLGVRRVLSACCRCGREYKRQHAKDESYPIK